MFHPLDHPLERGWVGRVEGARVIQLAAQTLQSFFTGGGTAREHAEYPLAEVRLLAPVLRPPAVRVFDGAASFAFANPAAIEGPGAAVGPSANRPSDTVSQRSLTVFPRIAAIVGAGGELAAFTILAEWRDPARLAPKDRDFALGLGPTAVSADELEAVAVVRVDGGERLRATTDGFDWDTAAAFAADGTELLTGDLLAGPSLGDVGAITAGSGLEVEIGGIGVLAQRVGG